MSDPTSYADKTKMLKYIAIGFLMAGVGLLTFQVLRRMWHKHHTDSSKSNIASAATTESSSSSSSSSPSSSPDAASCLSNASPWLANGPKSNLAMAESYNNALGGATTAMDGDMFGSSSPFDVAGMAVDEERFIDRFEDEFAKRDAKKNEQIVVPPELQSRVSYIPPTPAMIERQEAEAEEKKIRKQQKEIASKMSSRSQWGN